MRKPVLEFLEDIGLAERSDSGMFSIHGLKLGANSKAVPGGTYTNTVKTKAQSDADKTKITAVHGETGASSYHPTRPSAMSAINTAKGEPAKGSHIFLTKTKQTIDKF